jgi:hypothetical protein
MNVVSRMTRQQILLKTVTMVTISGQVVSHQQHPMVTIRSEVVTTVTIGGWAGLGSVDSVLDSTHALSRSTDRRKCLKTCGGQGRNRTADASLFRAVGSITYKAVFRGFIELRAFDLDAIWTPGAIPIEVGLHSDSTFRAGHGLHGLHSCNPATNGGGPTRASCARG